MRRLWVLAPFFWGCATSSVPQLMHRGLIAPRFDWPVGLHATVEAIQNRSQSSGDSTALYPDEHIKIENTNLEPIQVAEQIILSFSRRRLPPA